MTDKPKLKVLLAEDEPDIRELMTSCLQEIGDFEVRSYENGEGFVEKALDFSPDIISLDLMMPVVGGIEALKNIRQVDELRKIPVVLVTAKATEKDLASYESLNVAKIITKPFNVMDLSDIFLEIIGHEK